MDRSTVYFYKLNDTFFTAISIAPRFLVVGVVAMTTRRPTLWMERPANKKTDSTPLIVEKVDNHIVPSISSSPSTSMTIRDNLIVIIHYSRIRHCMALV